MTQKTTFTSQETIEIINLYLLEKQSVPQISKIYNKTPKQINYHLKKNGVILRDRSHAQRKYTINENTFEKIDTHEKAYWLGMLAGDGGVNADKTELRLSLQEKDHIAKFRDFLGSNHPIKFITNRPKNNGDPSITYYINIANKKLINDLVNFEIKPNKTMHMEMPKIDDEFFPSFLLGLFDADGCVYLYNKKEKHFAVMVMGPEQFMHDVQSKLIEKIGVSKTKLYKSGNTDWVKFLKYGGWENPYKMIKYMYSYSPVWLERKKTKAITSLLLRYPNDEWLISMSKAISK
jgi:hypothetical protein